MQCFDRLHSSLWRSKEHGCVSVRNCLHSHLLPANNCTTTVYSATAFRTIQTTFHYNSAPCPEWSCAVASRSLVSLTVTPCLLPSMVRSSSGTRNWSVVHRHLLRGDFNAPDASETARPQHQLCPGPCTCVRLRLGAGLVIAERPAVHQRQRPCLSGRAAVAL